MTAIQKTYTFVANTRALAAQVNQDFDDVIGFLTADHHNPAVFSNARPITNSGIAANAQIRDTQLYSQITRSGLINQTSLGQIDTPGIIKPSALPSLTTGFVVITSSQTWTKPSGVSFFTVELVGGGASGWGAAPNGAGVGGGAGAYVKKVFDSNSLSATVVVTIGTGGTGASNSGAYGGTTSFGAYLTAVGGTVTSTTSDGGVAAGGDLNIDGQNGSNAMSDAQTSGNPAYYTGIGGDSFMGHGNNIRQSVSPSGALITGNVGTGYGSGGGGGGTTSFGNNATGGNGRPGICIISW